MRSSEGVVVNDTVNESSSDASPVIDSDNVSSGESVKVKVSVMVCVSLIVRVRVSVPSDVNVFASVRGNDNVSVGSLVSVVVMESSRV